MTGERLCPTRLHWKGYAIMLRSLAEQPASAVELAERLGINRNTVQRVLRRLYDMGIVRRSRWTKPRLAGPWAAVWAFDDGEDVPRPLNKRGEPSAHYGSLIERVKPTSELVGFAILIRTLREPSSIADLSAASGASQGTVGRWVRAAREMKLVHLAEWRQRLHGGAPCPLYAVGINKPDAKRPATMPRRVVEQRYRTARRAKLAGLALTNALAANAGEFNEAQERQPEAA